MHFISDWIVRCFFKTAEDFFSNNWGEGVQAIMDLQMRMGIFGSDARWRALKRYPYALISEYRLVDPVLLEVFLLGKRSSIPDHLSMHLMIR